MYRTRYNWNNFSHSFLNLLRTNFICKYDILNIFDQNFIMCFLSCFWLQVYRERRESLVRILQFLRVAVHVKQCGGFRQIWCISGSHFLYWFGLGSEFYFESVSAKLKSKPFFVFYSVPTVSALSLTQPSPVPKSTQLDSMLSLTVLSLTYLFLDSAQLDSTLSLSALCLINPI